MNSPAGSEPEASNPLAIRRAKHGQAFHRRNQKSGFCPSGPGVECANIDSRSPKQQPQHSRSPKQQQRSGSLTQNNQPSLSPFGLASSRAPEKRSPKPSNGAKPYNHSNQGFGNRNYRLHNPQNRPAAGAVSTPPRMDPLSMQVLHSSKSGEEILVKIWHLPPKLRSTRHIHDKFFEYGHINHIFVSGHVANMRFSFHRVEQFMTPETLRDPDGRIIGMSVSLAVPETIASPVSPNKSFRKKLVISASSLDFGVLTGERRMMAMYTANATANHPVLFTLDMHTERSKRLDIRFFLSPELDASCYSMQLRLISPMAVLQICNRDGSKEMVVTSQESPRWWRSAGRDKLKEIHPNGSKSFNDWPKFWERVTDIDGDPEERTKSPVSLVRSNPRIDTGRWLTWKLFFPADHTGANYEEFMDALREHNISVTDVPEFSTSARMEPIIWKLLDPHKVLFESPLHELQDDMSHLSQDVRYQLEVCISNGKINEFYMDKEFLRQLGSMDKQRALMLLENVADSKRTFFNPTEIFSTSELRHSRKRRVPKDCVLMRTATITPTRVRIKTPGVEISNRVIRDNLTAAVEGYFLRVRFEDEDGGLRLISKEYDNQEEVWARVERSLRQGIDIAGRHYDWLACGNSQFREHGAYFFAPYNGKTAQHIRRDLGNFSNINVVAKCMARIGQCFSTTRAFTDVGRIDVQTIEDIERDGHCFTDGVGKISPFLAQMIASQFRIPTGPNYIPSVFQFRLGGCKGILALDPTLKGKIVQIRGSQTKFETPSEGLEIIRISSLSTSTLNQQLVLILSALGVPNDIFLNKMTHELQNIDLAMTDELLALELLQRNVDFNQVTLSIAEMIQDGFLHSEEPFVKSVLELWRAWNLKYLKEKAKIPIEKGAFVFGCVDESNTLKMDDGQLPEIFIQVKDIEGDWKPIQGICLLARNPSLHPGDVRVVRAVECPKLNHMKNVVVLPQQGRRPLASMCSGGDLDGDDYLVMWDEDLLPPEKNWNYPAMDYTAPDPVKCDGPVSDEHFTKFFVDYIKYNNLGVIAINHRATADLFAHMGGVKHGRCLELAQLHSQAVDFNKTGVPAKMDGRLFPTQYPHWIPGKPAVRTYRSKEVLGVLCDMVERAQFQPLLEKPFDKRILEAYEPEGKMLEDARAIKHDYDREIRRIMAQHDIKTEFEIWTAFVMNQNRECSWYSFAEEMGRLMGAVKSTFQEEVCKAVGIDSGCSAREESFTRLAPFVTAMYAVTAQEVAHHAKSKLIQISDGDAERPLISFPWLFYKELGKIATKRSGPRLQSSITTGLYKGSRRNMRPNTKYQAELDSIQMEPFAEWKASSVGDHVGIFAKEDTDLSRSVESSTERNSSTSSSTDGSDEGEKDAAEGMEKESVAGTELSTEGTASSTERGVVAGLGAADEDEVIGGTDEAVGGAIEATEAAEGRKGKSLLDQLDELLGA